VLAEQPAHGRAVVPVGLGFVRRAVVLDFDYWGIVLR
jgi:hypothetical protein